MFLLALLIINLIGTLAAREPDIDINRIRLIPREQFGSDSISHERRSVSKIRTNDYDNHSSGFNGDNAPLHLHVSTIDTKTTRSPIKVHQPREDPRFFYQSDAYLKETNGQNVNHEISFIYPGREVVRASDGPRSMSIREKNREQNLSDNGSNLCVRCPHDRTLIAKVGSDKVLLQAPRFFTCSGRRAPRSVQFIHMFGPTFGTLLEQGSYMIVGRITYNNKNIEMCKMQVHVVVQTCVTPKYLLSTCNKNKTCEFECRDPRTELRGPSSLACGADLKWSGQLPVCRARTWCEQPPPPEHGRLSCKGATVGASAGLAEGTKCRVRCMQGWRWHPRAISVCRRGHWTNTLTCQRTIKYRNT